MITKNIMKEDTYLDSVLLMFISRQLKELENVEEVSVIMATEANKEILKGIGLLTSEGAKAKPGDLIIAFHVSTEDAVKAVMEKAEELLNQRAAKERGQETIIPKSYEAALQVMPSANLALISVPGQYAGREATAVLESGRSVMIFSDNVSLEEEIRLKKRASELDLLVMGPDCGTAIINGVAMGFANAIRKGPFGIVGASGTGIQEVSTLLHKRGYGITQAIGLGGRDLSREVMGLSMLQGIRALENDPETEVVILISKPPAPEVANSVFDTIRNPRKKYIINFLNGDPAEAQKRNLRFAAGLEEAAELAIAALEEREFVATAFTDDANKIKARAQEERGKIGRGKVLRGLFSGGTLAEEALLILSRQIGDIYSNIPLRRELALKDNWKSYGNTIVDLGEDEFTRGRPHPMIDYTLRCDRLLEEAKDPGCAVVLLDVVLGYGSHPYPAETLAPAIQKAQQTAQIEGRYLAFVASICGTDEDPQHLAGQVATLEEVGATILPSNAQAARYAGLILKED